LGGFASFFDPQADGEQSPSTSFASDWPQRLEDRRPIRRVAGYAVVWRSVQKRRFAERVLPLSSSRSHRCVRR